MALMIPMPAVLMLGWLVSRWTGSLVDAGGRWWTLVDTGGHWWTLVNTGGHWWTLVDAGGRF